MIRDVVKRRIIGSPRRLNVSGRCNFSLEASDGHSWSSALSNVITQLADAKQPKLRPQAAPDGAIGDPASSGAVASESNDVQVASLEGNMEWLTPLRSKSKKFWSDRANCVRFLKWLQITLKIQHPEDWYKIEKKIINSHGGNGLLMQHDRSILAIARLAHPDHIWHPWRFSSVDRSHWKLLHNRKDYLLYWSASKELSEWRLTDHPWRWTLVPRSKLRSIPKFSSLLANFDHSVLKAVRETFPDEEWHPWIVGDDPSWINDPVQRKKWLFWFLEEFALLNHGANDDIPQTRDDLPALYKVSREQLCSLPGGPQMVQFYGHVLTVAKACAPDHAWIPWKFDRLPNGFWADTANQIAYFSWLSREHLHLKHLSEFYSINLETTARETGALAIIRYCHPWPIAGLKSAFPNHRWLPWRFKKIPNGHWNDDSNVREFLLWVAECLGFERELRDEHPAPAQWYSLTCAQLIQQGGASLVVAHNYRLSDIVRRAFPRVVWEGWRFERQANSAMFGKDSPMTSTMV
jgi:hypothetical protein